MTLEKEQLMELTSIIEDTVEYATEQWGLPSKTTWTVVESLASSKLMALKALIK